MPVHSEGREPVVVWESEDPDVDGPTILDGHNRYEICTRKNIAFDTVEAEHCHSRADAIAWIAANQLGRRNLTPSQWAAFSPEWEKQLAAEAKKRQAHGQTAPGKTLVERIPQASDGGKARDKAAEILGINPHYVTDAKKIERDAPCSPHMMTHANPCVSFVKKRHL